MNNWELLKDEIKVRLKINPNTIGYDSVLSIMKNIEEGKIIPGESLKVFEERKRKENKRKAICSQCNWYECRGCSNEKFNSKCYHCPCDECKDGNFDGFTKLYDE